MNLIGKKAVVLRPPDEPDASIQPPELDALADDIVREYEKRRQARRPQELKWRLNQRFLAGDQYCDLALDIGELIEREEGRRERAVYNMIAPIVETRLSKLSRVQPGLTVRPQTGEAADVTSARLATRLLKSAYIAQDMLRLQSEAARWAEVCGSAFYKIVWNPRAGLPLGVLKNGKPVYEGDLATTVVPAYEIFPENACLNGLESQNSLIHARVYTVKEIFNRWNVRLPGRAVSIYGADAPLSADKTEQDVIEDAETVIEWYERPGRDFPEGRHITVAGGRVLYIGPLPFLNGPCGRRDFPFAQQLCLSAPGCFFGSTVVERMIPLQRDYNAVINRINEHTARMTSGNLLAEQGSLVNESLLDEGFEPGAVVEYRPGSTPPCWMSVSDVPDSLAQRLASLRRDFNDVSGVSEMARASNVSGSISSGVALEILREQDDTRLTLTSEHIRRAIKTVGEHWLRLMRQFAPSTRVTRTAGADDADLMLLSWQGSDLTSDDIVIDTDNELNNTPAQRRQLALELMNAGLFLDPDTHQLSRENRARLMDIFKMGNWENAAAIDELHQDHARREQLDLERGIVPRLMPVDNHELHLAEHTRFILGAEYRRLEREKPALAQALVLHAEAHRALMNGAHKEV